MRLSLEVVVDPPFSFLKGAFGYSTEYEAAVNVAEIAKRAVKYLSQRADLTKDWSLDKFIIEQISETTVHELIHAISGIRHDKWDEYAFDYITAAMGHPLRFAIAMGESLVIPVASDCIRRGLIVIDL